MMCGVFLYLHSAVALALDLLDVRALAPDDRGAGGARRGDVHRQLLVGAIGHPPDKLRHGLPDVLGATVEQEGLRFRTREPSALSLGQLDEDFGALADLL